MGFYYMGGALETLSMRPTPRRTKRHVPDGEKDTKYWEKRKRNNDAARRSRETKRRLDVDFRQRLLLLEEELNLARKELTVIKVKFGLPLDQRFMEVDERGELIPSNITAPTILSPILLPRPHAMTSKGMSNDDGYSMPSPTRVSTENHTVLPISRPVGSNSKYQGVPHSETQQHSQLAAMSQTSSNNHMPVKKQRRGRKDWQEEADHQANESGEDGDGGTSSGDNAYYGRMLPGAPYPGLLWSPSIAAAQVQFPFHGQMQMMGTAAYQTLMDEQPCLPSINAFSNTPVKCEQSRSQQGSSQHQQPQQRHHHHQQSVQQQFIQQRHHAQSHSQQNSQQQINGRRGSSSGDESFDYLTSVHTSLPIYYVPYSEKAEVARRSPPSVGPADLSLTKSHHHMLNIPTSAVPTEHPARGIHHQQIGVVQPMQANQQQQCQQQRQQSQYQNISSASDEDEQKRLLVENSDIRNQLQQLTAEVAKMKDYVLKDNNVRDIATSRGTNNSTVPSGDGQ